MKPLSLFIALLLCASVLSAQSTTRPTTFYYSPLLLNYFNVNNLLLYLPPVDPALEATTPQMENTPEPVAPIAEPVPPPGAKDLAGVWLASARRGLLPPYVLHLPSRDYPRAGVLDLFHSTWDLDGFEGTTTGITPSLILGEQHEFSFKLPLHVLDPDSVDRVFAAGLDAAYRYTFPGALAPVSIGVHGYGVHLRGEEDSTTLRGGGPFGSLTFGGRSVLLSLGILLEYTVPEEGDTLSELVPGANLGLSLTESLAWNVFGYVFHNLDAAEGADDTYQEIGSEVVWTPGGWLLRLGVKSVQGIEDVDILEFYLGSAWRF